MSKTNENVIDHVTAKTEEIKAHTDTWLTEFKVEDRQGRGQDRRGPGVVAQVALVGADRHRLATCRDGDRRHSRDRAGVLMR